MPSGDDSEVALDVRQLVGRLYEVVDELELLFPGRSFTPDGHLVGSLGECLGAGAFNLTLNPASTEGYDAMSEDGRKVEIKATQGSSVALSVVDEVIADMLLVLKLNRDGSFDVAYNGPADPAWAASGKPQKNGQRRISLSKLRTLDKVVPADLRLIRHIPQLRS
jgi:hypothetical protein